MKYAANPNWILIILTALSMAFALVERYSSSAVAAENRLSTVEAHEQSTNQRLDRMEDKLDVLVYHITGIRPTREERSCPTCATASTPP